MNKQQYHEALSSVHASDALLNRVLSPDENRKPVINRWNTVRRLVAVAAVLAILLTALLWPVEEDGYITAPYGVRVYACEIEGNMSVAEEYELRMGEKPPYKAIWCPFASLTASGSTMSLVVDDQSLNDHRITFEISTNYGELHADTKEAHYVGLGKNGTLENKNTVYWTGNELLHQYRVEAEKIASSEGIYVDVIVKADEVIVGYAVIEMWFINPDIFSFAAVLRATEMYPKENGQFQNITEEFIAEKIAEAKK